MYKSVKNIDGRGEAIGPDNQCLLVCSKDKSLTLLQAARSNGHVLSFLPLSGSTLTLVAPDAATKISDGSTELGEIKITGQNIVTLLSDGARWYIAGNVRAPDRPKTPKRKPPQEAALT